MTEVRIRDEDDAVGKTLGDVPFDQIDTVIPTVGSWGLHAGDDVDTDVLRGQFVYDETGAFFEVVFTV